MNLWLLMLNFCCVCVSDGTGIKDSNRGGIVEQTLADADKLLVDFSSFSAEGKSGAPKVVGSASTVHSLGDGIVIKSIDNTTPSKRKRDQMIVNVDTSATDARKYVCNPSSDDINSPSTSKNVDVLKKCVACSKRPRLVAMCSFSLFLIFWKWLMLANISINKISFVKLTFLWARYNYRRSTLKLLMMCCNKVPSWRIGVAVRKFTMI